MTTRYEPGTEVTLRHFTGSCSATVLHDEGGTHVRIKAGGQSRTVPRDNLRPRGNGKPVTGSISRPFTRARVEGVAVERETAWRSPKYLAFVRAAGECCCCGRSGPVEAHHWGPDGGMSQKCSDAFTVPLAPECHRHFHDTGALPGRTREVTERIFMDTQRRLLARWIRGER